VDDYFHGPSKDVSSCLQERVVPIRRLGLRRISVPDQRSA
jgi:hypothetical protein